MLVLPGWGGGPEIGGWRDFSPCARREMRSVISIEGRRKDCCPRARKRGTGARAGHFPRDLSPDVLLGRPRAPLACSSCGAQQREPITLPFPLGDQTGMVVAGLVLSPWPEMLRSPVQGPLGCTSLERTAPPQAAAVGSPRASQRKAWSPLTPSRFPSRG